MAQAVQICVAHSDDSVAAHWVHESWIGRRRAEGKDKEDWLQPMLVPFHQLPADEQEKDLVFVREVRGMLGQSRLS